LVTQLKYRHVSVMCVIVRSMMCTLQFKNCNNDRIKCSREVGCICSGSNEKTMIMES